MALPHKSNKDPRLYLKNQEMVFWGLFCALAKQIRIIYYLFFVQDSGMFVQKPIICAKQLEIVCYEVHVFSGSDVELSRPAPVFSEGQFAVELVLECLF